MNSILYHISIFLLSYKEDEIRFEVLFDNISNLITTKFYMYNIHEVIDSLETKYKFIILEKNYLSYTNIRFKIDKQKILYYLRCAKIESLDDR